MIYLTNQGAEQAEFTPPGFIVGVGRSGTTLLASILNRHPEIFVAPETHFFRHLYSYPGGLARFQKNWPVSLKQIMAKMHPTKSWEPDADEIIGRFKGNFPGAKELFLAIGKQIGKKETKRLWIEKTPNHINYLPQIRKLFPDAPIIHIVRDGRDVALSLSRMKWAGAGPDYIENLIHWKKEINLACDFGKTDIFFYSLRYEDLILNAEKEIQMLCNFLGIRFYPSILIPDGSEDSLIEVESTHKELIKKPPDSSRCFVWKRTLNQERIQTSDLILGKELIFWNYPVMEQNEEFRGKLIIIPDSIWRKSWSSAVSDVVDVLVAKQGLKPIVLTNLTDVLKQHKIYWVLSSFPSAPKGISDLFNSVKTLFALLLLCIKGIKFIWCYEGDKKRETAWSKLIAKRIIARFSYVIICACSNSETCNTDEILSLPRSRIIHSERGSIEAVFKKVCCKKNFFSKCI